MTEKAATSPVTLLAMASSGDVFITQRKVGGMERLEVHLAPGDHEPRPITETEAARAIALEGLVPVYRAFSSWAELDRFRLTNVVPVASAPELRPIVEARAILNALRKLAVDPLESATAFRLARFYLEDDEIAADGTLRRALLQIITRAAPVANESEADSTQPEAKQRWDATGGILALAS